MGNILRCLWRDCCNPKPLDEESLPPHGVAPATAGFSALARDLLHFEVTAQVPQGLSQHVQSSRKAQANWYRKLLEAWKEAKPPPRNAEEASRLILETLQRHRKADVQGLLSFYGLPYPAASVEVPGEIPVPQKWPKGVKYELHTLQVDARAIADGDTITVYVDTKNPRESAAVPMSVVEAMIQRRKARMKRDFERADALQKEISDAGYRVWDAPKHGEGEDILAHKYRIRLRGVDAPESKMPYGKQAKEALLNLIEGKCLHILVYDEDRYGRTVGDVFCDGVFIQVIEQVDHDDKINEDSDQMQDQLATQGFDPLFEGKNKNEFYDMMENESDTTKKKSYDMTVVDNIQITKDKVQIQIFLNI